MPRYTKTIDVLFPLAGLERRMGYQNKSTGPYTTPDCLNVRSQDVFLDRLRGGSRPGLVQVLPPKYYEIDDPPAETPITVSIIPTSDGGGYSGDPTLSRGPLQNITGRSISTQRYHTWFHFNLNNIPTSTINSATLYMTVTGLSETSGTMVFTINRLTQTSWVENEASWTNYSSGNAWAVAGGDYTATGAISFLCPTTAGTDALSVDIKTLVEDAMTNRSKQLHFLIKKDNESTNSVLTCASTEATYSYQYPRLVVEYTET